MAREYTTPKVNATMKQIMNEAYGARFKVVDIAKYFGFKQSRVYEILDIRGLKKQRNENMPIYDENI